MSVNTKSMALWFLYLTNGSAVLFLERTQGDQTGLRNLRYRARWFVVVASFASQLEMVLQDEGGNFYRWVLGQEEALIKK